PPPMNENVFGAPKMSSNRLRQQDSSSVSTTPSTIDGMTTNPSQKLVKPTMLPEEEACTQTKMLLEMVMKELDTLRAMMKEEEKMNGGGRSGNMNSSKLLSSGAMTQVDPP